MPKFFIFSDCHGYANELKTALDQAGFDPNNQEHWLIGVGDYLDRGRQPQEVIDFLMNLDRVKLVKGNHNILLMQCISRGYPEYYDWHNGTAQTIIDLAPEAQTFQEACNVAYEKIKDFTGSMVNYVELKNHIFVHSWIPLKYDGSFNPDWRNVTQEEWNSAMWSNPFELAEQGLNQTDKTLIFGHWHCSTGWAKKEGRSEFGYDAKFDPYYGDGYIGVDACTTLSGKVNVLVLEDEFIEEQ